MLLFSATTYKSGLFALCATLVHWLIFFLLLQFSIAASLASFLGASAGAFLNYLFQFYGVFHHTATHSRSATRYLFLLIANVPVNTGLFILFANVISMNVFLAQLLASAIVALSNLCFYQKAIFNERVN